MKISAKSRWSLYAIAAVLTVAAMWLVKPREDGDIVMPVRATSPSRPSAKSPKSAKSAAEAPDQATPDAIARLKRQIEAAIGHAGVDPFRDGPTADELAAAAAAQAAAVTAQAVAAAQQQRTVAAAPPPPAAPPFRYLGRWTEQGRTLAYLQSGDRVLEVRGPGPLDGSPWRVVALGDEVITLQMAKGPRHTLSFDAAGNDKPAPAAAPAAATPAVPVAAGTPAAAPAKASPATPAGAAPSATSAQETPSSSSGIEHAAGWEEN